MQNSIDYIGIESFIEDVLIHRFPHEQYKHKPKITSKGIRFHCPYCGDTYNIRSEPRGNLYMKTKRYKCFNGGCFVSVSLESFISKFVDEYDLSIDGIDLSEIKSDYISNTYYNDLVLTKDNNIYDYIDDMGLIDSMPHIDELKYIFSLKNVYNVSTDSNVYKFLYDRGLYQIPNLDKKVYCDNFDSRVFIMNMDDVTGRVLSYSSRSVTHKSYIIQIYSDFFKNWNPPKELDPSHIEFLDNISSYYNILNVDFTDDVNVTEGQFDAMFLKNHLALQGVSKIDFILKHIQSDNINIFMDMDSAGYQTVAKMMKGYRLFLWTKFIHNLKKVFYKKIKDINKIHDVNDVFKFLFFESGCTFTCDQFNKIVNKYISNNEYDHFFI